MEESLARLADLLDVTEVPLFQETLQSLIESIALKLTKSVKQRFKSSLKQTQSDLQSSLSALSSQVQTSQQGYTMLKQELQELSSTQTKEIKRLKSQRNAGMDAAAKVERIEQQVDYLKDVLAQVSVDVAVKANARELDRINEKIATLCPVLYAERLELGLKSKAEGELVGKLETDLAEIQQTITANYMLKSDLDAHLRQWQAQSDASTKGLVSIHYFTRVMSALEKTNKGLQAQLRELTSSSKQDLATLSTLCAQLQTTLNSKATISQVEETNRLFTGYATVDIVEECGRRMEQACVYIEDVYLQMTKILEKQDLVLQRYDEILLDKANKTDLIQLERRLTPLDVASDLGIKLSGVESDVNTLLAKQAECEHWISDCETKVGEIQVNSLISKGEKRDYQAIFTSLQSISEKIDSKVDKSDFVSISSASASKTEVETLVQTLSSMYRIDKIVITLLHHSIKCLSDVTAEVSPANIQSAEWLNKHAEMVAAWANLYEPMGSDIEFPPEILPLIATKSAKGLMNRPSLSPLGFTGRKKSPVPGAVSPIAHILRGSSKRLAAKRGESFRRNGAYLPSLDATLDNI